LTFDFTSDQEQQPNPPPHTHTTPPPKKELSGGKKGRTLQESNRGGSLSRMDRTIDVM